MGISTPGIYQGRRLFETQHLLEHCVTFNFRWAESIIIFAQWKQAAEC